MKKIVFILLLISSQIFSYTTCVKKSDKYEDHIKSYNAPARIENQASWDIIASASFIYWHPKQLGIDLGILTSSDLKIKCDEIIDFKTHFYPGFTVSLGTNFHYDNWNADISYTRFHIREQQNQPIPSWSNGIIYQPYNSLGTFSVINTNWKQQLDYADLFIGRAYYNGKNLVIKPNLSVKGGWTKQTYQIEGFVLDIYREVKLKSNSWFLGPQLSADFNWIFTSNIRIFLTTAASLLYQIFHSDYVFFTNDISNLIRNLSNKTIQITPNLNMKCGIGWSSFLDHNNWHIDLLFAYDFLYFWNQNEFTAIQELRDFFNYHSPGDLMIHGLEVSLKINF